MLARGALCRLAADVPKTPTHDLSQLARLIRRATTVQNGASLSSMRAVSHAYNVSIAQFRRSYASAASATKPTATIKKAVKKAAAKKPATKKTAKVTSTATKSTRKKAPAKKTTKAKTRGKAKAKKPAAKKTRKAKKVLTPEEKQKALIRELRGQALKGPPRPLTSAYIVFVAEQSKGKKDVQVSEVARDIASKFKNLTPAEREHYNHLANESKAEKQAAYDQWVRSHTPDTIRVANNARRRLRIILKDKVKGTPAHTHPIADDRQVKKPVNAYSTFFGERHKSGDFRGIPLAESGKLIANEWKALSEGEKKKYQGEAEASLETYKKEKVRVYGKA